MSHINVCEREIRISGRFIRIAQLEADGFQFLRNPEEILAALRRSGHRIDLFTFLQQMPDTTPRYSYPMELDNLAVLPITTFDHWWTKQIQYKARNKAKQAAKQGVIIREVPFNDNLARGISEIYNEVPVRQGRPFWHYRKSFDAVYKELATFPDSSIFIGAFLEESLIGFIKLVHDEARTQAATMQIISMMRHRDKAPTNALVAQAVRSCADRGFSYFIYSRFAYGKKKESGLSDFKERNGFAGVDLPRYYVPLSPLGDLAQRLDLHHRFVDHLPEFIVSKVRKARTMWYSRGMSTVETS